MATETVVADVDVDELDRAHLDYASELLDEAIATGEKLMRETGEVYS